MEAKQKLIEVIYLNWVGKLNVGAGFSMHKNLGACKKFIQYWEIDTPSTTRI